MPHFIDVVFKIAPEGLADATPSGRVIVGGSTSTFRLDQFVNGENRAAAFVAGPAPVQRASIEAFDRNCMSTRAGWRALYLFFVSTPPQIAMSEV